MEPRQLRSVKIRSPRFGGDHGKNGPKMARTQAPQMQIGQLIPVAFNGLAEMRLLEAYITPESQREAIINELIALFDGPQQQKAKKLAAEVLDEVYAAQSHDYANSDAIRPVIPI